MNEFKSLEQLIDSLNSGGNVTTDLDMAIILLIAERLDKQDDFYAHNKERHNDCGPGFWLYIPATKSPIQAVYDGSKIDNLVYVPITDKAVKPFLVPAIIAIRAIVTNTEYDPSTKGVVMMYPSHPYKDITTKRYQVTWSLLKK